MLDEATVEEVPPPYKHCCPRCLSEYVCPCRACTFRLGTKTQTWQFLGHDILCLTCGFTASHDWWLDLEMSKTFPDKNYVSNLGQEIAQISAKYPDWREVPADA